MCWSGLCDTVCLLSSSLHKHVSIALYAFFWVIPRRLNFICRRFGTLCLFHLHRSMKMKQSVPKRRHIKFRRRGITRNKAHNIQNMVNVWNQECLHRSYWQHLLTAIGLTPGGSSRVHIYTQTTQLTTFVGRIPGIQSQSDQTKINPLNAELNPICYLLALLDHHIFHVSGLRVKDELTA